MHHQATARRWYFAEVVTFHNVRRHLLALVNEPGRYWGRAPQVDEELRRHGLDLADLIAMLRSARVLRSCLLGAGGYSWIFSGSTVDSHIGIGTVEAWNDRVVLLDLQVDRLVDGADPQQAA